MPTMALTNNQVFDLVRQLPPLPKRTALFSLAREAAPQRINHMAYAETQLHQAAAQRGFDWDTMSEDERETFIDNLLHEA